jgi:nucleoid-associated protein YgaU
MPKPRHHYVIVKRGDTLSEIAVREYKNAKWWRNIAKANKIRDPKNLKVGQRLRMP